MPAKKAKAASRKAAKPSVVARRDQPKPTKAARKVPAPKGRKAQPPALVARRDTLDPEGATAAQLLRELRKGTYEFRRAESHARFDESSFYEFFGAEIDAELRKEATIFNDRYARWPCQCCDVVIPVPRRTEVFHGDYHLVHDDVMGLLVNGERWIPKAETPIQVVQPGRLRNPWTGRTLEGRDLGTTGIAS